MKAVIGTIVFIIFLSVVVYYSVSVIKGIKREPQKTEVFTLPRPNTKTILFDEMKLDKWQEFMRSDRKGPYDIDFSSFISQKWDTVWISGGSFSSQIRYCGITKDAIAVTSKYFSPKSHFDISRKITTKDTGNVILCSVYYSKNIFYIKLAVILGMLLWVMTIIIVFWWVKNNL